jgi:hypothetical protein
MTVNKRMLCFFVCLFLVLFMFSLLILRWRVDESIAVSLCVQPPYSSRQYVYLYSHSIHCLIYVDEELKEYFGYHSIKTMVFKRNIYEEFLGYDYMDRSL